MRTAAGRNVDTGKTVVHTKHIQSFPYRLLSTSREKKDEQQQQRKRDYEIQRFCILSLNAHSFFFVSESLCTISGSSLNIIFGTSIVHFSATFAALISSDSSSSSSSSSNSSNNNSFAILTTRAPNLHRGSCFSLQHDGTKSIRSSRICRRRIVLNGFISTDRFSVPFLSVHVLLFIISIDLDL